MLKGKKILIGITSGIAAYKIPSLIRLLKKNGAEVTVILTKNALNFVTQLTLKTLSVNEVYVDNFEYKNFEVEHISLCDKHDLFLIAPLTCNTLGKIANGICDNLLTSVFFAFNKPIIICPSMNANMWKNKITSKNIETIQSLDNISIMYPKTGELACGINDVGRMSDVEEIYNFISNHFLYEKKFLKGKKFLITAGGTIEKIDPVRYISNFSSGKMGYELAINAYFFGAQVDFLCTFDVFNAPFPTKKVFCALEMFDYIKENFKNYTDIIMTSAVSDYRVENISLEKIKKQNDSLTIKLIKNPDILEYISKNKSNNQTIIGFCAESNNLIENAKTKIKQKNCDYLIANDISNGECGFSSDYNEVFILNNNNDNIVELKKDKKSVIAKKILENIYG